MPEPKVGDEKTWIDSHLEWKIQITGVKENGVFEAVVLEVNPIHTPECTYNAENDLLWPDVPCGCWCHDERFETSNVCGFRWYYTVYDETEWDSCGAKAVGCSLDADSDAGRCFDHLPNFDYLWAWGFVPKPNEVIVLVDRPHQFSNEPFGILTEVDDA